jgi:hypothetical protein
MGSTSSAVDSISGQTMRWRGGVHRRHRAHGGLGIGPTATAHHRDVAPPAGDLHFEIAPGVMADILSRLEEPASLYRVRFAPGPPKLSTPSPRSVSSRAEPAA